MPNGQIPFDPELFFCAVRGHIGVNPRHKHGTDPGPDGRRSIEHRYTVEELGSLQGPEVERVVKGWLMNFTVCAGSHCTYGLLPRPLPSEAGKEYLVVKVVF